MKKKNPNHPKIDQIHLVHYTVWFGSKIGKFTNFANFNFTEWTHFRNEFKFTLSAPDMARGLITGGTWDQKHLKKWSLPRSWGNMFRTEQSVVNQKVWGERKSLNFSGSFSFETWDFLSFFLFFSMLMLKYEAYLVEKSFVTNKSPKTLGKEHKVWEC